MYKPTGFIALPTLGLLILVAAGIAFGSWWIAGREEAVAPTIKNFTECAAAGNPVMESYPRQCAVNGQTFVEVIANTNTVVNENTNVVVNSNVNAAANTNTAADPTTGWKTYTNAKLGYSIKYPKDWIVEETADKQEVDIYNKISANGKFGAPAVQVIKNEKLQSDDSCLEAEVQAKVNNILRTRQTMGCAYAGSRISTFFPKDSEFIAVTWTTDWEDFYPQYETILTTFTFIDETENWNEFTNKPWGFSFKYPKEWKVLQNSIQAIDTMGLPENVLKIGTSPRPIFVLYVDPMGWGVGNVHYAITVKKQNDKFIIVEGKPTGAKTGEFGLSEYYSVSVRQENTDNPRIYISFDSAIKAEESAEFNSLVRQIISTFTFTK